MRPEGASYAQLSGTCACLKDLHAWICKPSTRFVPKVNTHLWAQVGYAEWEDSHGRAFPFLGTLCPFPKPHCRPGRALWGQGQPPLTLPTILRKLGLGVPAGNSFRALRTDSSARLQSGSSTPAVSISLGQRWSRQFRISLLSFK